MQGKMTESIGTSLTWVPQEKYRLSETAYGRVARSTNDHACMGRLQIEEENVCRIALYSIFIDGRCDADLELSFNCVEIET